jgi:hypothetical protein
MDYLSDLHKIEQTLLALDDISCDTIEEANMCLIKYDSLKDDIISVIKRLLEDFSISVMYRECVYDEAIRILINYIGSADDIQKYGSMLDSFHNENKITKQQLNSFCDSLDIGRWR